MLTVGSLFSGIGGLDLGLERAGMQVIWQSEINDYASRVLKKHWPEVPNHGDIKTIRWGDVVRPDVICGGYPCQPFSIAGKRKGEQDPRHLWPWVRQAIGELRPRYAILENVRGHLSVGATTVIGEITALGYDCEWRVVSAASVGAVHRRDRLFIVAHDERERNGERGIAGDAGQTDSGGVYHGSRQNGYVGGEWWKVEPNVGRVADGVPARVDRLRGLGNAVVPQVAEIIGRLVVAHAEHN